MEHEPTAQEKFIEQYRHEIEKFFALPKEEREMRIITLMQHYGATVGDPISVTR